MIEKFCSVSISRHIQDVFGSTCKTVITSLGACVIGLCPASFTRSSLVRYLVPRLETILVDYIENG